MSFRIRSNTNSTVNRLNILNNPVTSESFVVTVTRASQLTSNVLDSSKFYLIDGVIDIGSDSIVIPKEGCSIAGSALNVSQIRTSDSNATIFVSDTGGSGHVIIRQVSLSCTGLGSQVFNITSDIPTIHNLELIRVRFDDCMSLGTITDYGNGLEVETVRIGGSPQMTLAGTWNGYFINTSLIRALSSSFAGSIFSAGLAFTMSSRFRTNWNADLPALASLCDFSPSNFSNPSIFQVQDCLIAREGILNPSDTNYFPKTTAGDISNTWINNVGINNTRTGGTLKCTAEILTVISTVNTPVLLLGTFEASSLQHFDSPSNGQLRFIGVSPREYMVFTSLILEGGSNDTVTVRLMKFDFNTSTFGLADSQKRVINDLSGGRNTSNYIITSRIILNQNDYIFIEVENNTDVSNITSEIGGTINVVTI